MSSTITGVVLAAGRGRRMGGGKQLTPWPGPRGTVPLVAAAYDAIAPACTSMLVVLGHRADEVAAALGDRPFTRIDADPDAPMSDSLKAALRAAGDTAVLLQPGDHPSVAQQTLRVLLDQQDEARAVIPTFEGRGGHPVLLPAALAIRLRDEILPTGLRGFWHEHPDACVRLAVDDDGVVRGINRPEHLG